MCIFPHSDQTYCIGCLPERPAAVPKHDTQYFDKNGNRIPYVRKTHEQFGKDDAR